jgi:hypothetical protein
VGICVCERESKLVRESEYVCVCVSLREIVSKIDNERECLCVCVCVCVRESY